MADKSTFSSQPPGEDSSRPPTPTEVFFAAGDPSDPLGVKVPDIEKPKGPVPTSVTIETDFGETFSYDAPSPRKAAEFLAAHEGDVHLGADVIVSGTQVPTIVKPQLDGAERAGSIIPPQVQGVRR